jgi:predicted ATPase
MERFLRATLLGSQTEQFFRRLFYLGPLREWPQRAYVASGQSPADVGFKGESSVDVMWVRARHKKTREPLEAHMNRWIEKFGIGQGLRLKRLGGNLYSVVLTGQKAGVDVNLADVGFGASQVLPIIVEVFHAPEDSALLIEQPEIHLHPAAQLTLGDLLVDGAGRGLTLLVETHSEHLISRVQRRIAEGAISENDVALYYVQPDLMGAQAKRIEIDRRGQLVEGTVPNGFFEEGFGETLEHARVLANR